jgi:hypothetical protein
MPYMLHMLQRYVQLILVHGNIKLNERVSHELTASTGNCSCYNDYNSGNESVPTEREARTQDI